MGQRTLILLLLCVVIVAIAAVQGVQMFTEGAALHRRDAITQRSVQLGTETQSWALQPSIFGGGGGSFENVDVWRVTERTNDGDEWMTEDQTEYRIVELAEPGFALVSAVDSALDLRVDVVFDAREIASTTLRSSADGVSLYDDSAYELK